MQQHFEISGTTGIDEPKINLEMYVFLNLTTNYSQLKVENEDLESLRFQLIGMQNKIIQNKKVVEIYNAIKYESSIPRMLLFDCNKKNPISKNI